MKKARTLRPLPRPDWVTHPERYSQFDLAKLNVPYAPAQNVYDERGNMMARKDRADTLDYISPEWQPFNFTDLSPREQRRESAEGLTVRSKSVGGRPRDMRSYRSKTENHPDFRKATDSSAYKGKKKPALVLDFQTIESAQYIDYRYQRGKWRIDVLTDTRKFAGQTERFYCRFHWNRWLVVSGKGFSPTEAVSNALRRRCLFIPEMGMAGSIGDCFRSVRISFEGAAEDRRPMPKVFIRDLNFSHIKGGVKFSRAEDVVPVRRNHIPLNKRRGRLDQPDLSQSASQRFSDMIAADQRRYEENESKRRQPPQPIPPTSGLSPETIGLRMWYAAYVKNPLATVDVPISQFIIEAAKPT